MDTCWSDLAVQLDRFWEDEIRPQWRPEAERIVAKLATAPAVIVSGPHFAAKSGCLIPELKEAALRGGFNSPTVAFAFAETIEELSQECGLVILDEIGFLHPKKVGGEQMQRFVRCLDQRAGKTKLIGIVACPTARNRRSLRRWFQASLPLSYRGSMAHALETRLVDAESAVKIFTLLGAEEELQQFIREPESRALRMPGYLAQHQNIAVHRLKHGEPPLRTVKDLNDLFQMDLVRCKYGLLYQGWYSSSRLVEKLLLNLGWSPNKVRYIGLRFAD